MIKERHTVQTRATQRLAQLRQQLAVGRLNRASEKRPGACLPLPQESHEGGRAAWSSLPDPPVSTCMLLVLQHDTLFGKSRLTCHNEIKPPRPSHCMCWSPRWLTTPGSKLAVRETDR